MFIVDNIFYQIINYVVWNFLIL